MDPYAVGSRPSSEYTPPTRDGTRVAPTVDHTLLAPDASHSQIMRVCREALQYGFAAVCVTPYWLPLVARTLQGSAVRSCVVIGFPLGADHSETKAQEARICARLGAAELDMTLAVAALKAGDHDYVLHDIQAVVQAAQGKTVKVILETALLSRAQKIEACALALRAGAGFVKTSSGFFGGATLEDVRLLRRCVGDEAGVKASGGIRTCAEACAMLQAGASRIGASAGVAIVTGHSDTDRRCR